MKIIISTTPRLLKRLPQNAIGMETYLQLDQHTNCLCLEGNSLYFKKKNYCISRENVGLKDMRKTLDVETFSFVLDKSTPMSYWQNYHREPQKVKYRNRGGPKKP